MSSSDSSTPVRIEGITPLDWQRLQDAYFQDRRREGFHFVEVEHGLNVMGATAVQQAGILESGLRANVDAIGAAASDLRACLSDVGEALCTAIENDTYQLHEDNIASQNLLLRVWEGVNPAGFNAEVARLEREENERRHLALTQQEYSEALAIMRSAAHESNRTKQALMLREAQTCFERASRHPLLCADAYLQLGTLHLLRDGDLGIAETRFGQALGEPFSPHWVRVSRLLANIEFRRGNIASAYRRSREVVDHHRALDGAATRLVAIGELEDWGRREEELGALLAAGAAAPSVARAFSAIRSLVGRGRVFTALEHIEKHGRTMAAEILSLRPDPSVYFDAARYAARLGRDLEARQLLERNYELLGSDLSTRLAFLAEARATPEFAGLHS